MALVDSASWSAFTGQSLSGAEATALSAICSAVDLAIKRMCAPYLFEPATVTGVCDAPTRSVLALPVFPVRSITSLWYNPDANGDPAAFTSDYLLTQYTDYYMPLDPVESLSRWGLVERRGVPSWGCERPALYDRLAPNMTPGRGAIKYTVAAGHTSVPGDVAAAAALAVSLLMKRKEGGAPATSESFNGASYSLASQFLADAAVNSPDVRVMLMRYTSIVTAGA